MAGFGYLAGLNVCLFVCLFERHSDVFFFLIKKRFNLPSPHPLFGKSSALKFKDIRSSSNVVTFSTTITFVCLFV